MLQACAVVGFYALTAASFDVQSSATQSTPAGDEAGASFTKSQFQQFESLDLQPSAQLIF